MKSKAQFIFLFVLVLLATHAVQAQQTSRVIPFSGVSTTIAAGTSGQVLTLQLWDAATGGQSTLLRESDAGCGCQLRHQLRLRCGFGTAIPVPVVAAWTQPR
jgi:hypothetical protein